MRGDAGRGETGVALEDPTGWGSEETDAGRIYAVTVSLPCIVGLSLPPQHVSQ